MKKNKIDTNIHIARSILDCEARVRYHQHAIEMSKEVIESALEKITSHKDEIKDLNEAILLLKGVI